MASCHTHATCCQSSHRIHRSFWRRIFSHGFHRCSQIFRLRCCLLICAYPCLSVGGFLCQNVLCVPRVLWEHSLCLLCWCCRGNCTSVVVFSHGFHGFPQKLGCVIGGVGMAGCHTLLICVHLCLSVGDFLRQTVLCVPRVLWKHSLCLLCWCCRSNCTSVVVFSHGFHGFSQMVRLRYWRRGYGRDAIPS